MTTFGVMNVVEVAEYILEKTANPTVPPAGSNTKQNLNDNITHLEWNTQISAQLI